MPSPLDPSGYLAAFGATVRPRQHLSLAQWLDQGNRHLPRESSSEPGRYDLARTPFWREPADSLTDPTIQEIAIVKGTQIGGTELGNSWLLYLIDRAPGPAMMILPSLELAENHSRQKLQPSLDACKPIAGKIASNRSRDGGNSLLCKQFQGGVIFLAGANSAASFRSKSIKYLILDDIDGFPSDVDGEGCPVALAKKRTDTFSSRKILEISTPTVKGLSRIEKSFTESDQRYYELPCPLCNHYQRLEFSQLKFTRNEAGEVKTAHYECIACQGKIKEHHKTKMLAQGRWVPTYPGRSKRGYHLSSLYSPLGWVSWKQICQEFLEAKNNRERLKVFKNTRLAETWEEQGQGLEAVELSNRCEPYAAFEIPVLPAIVTAGVDVQDSRLNVLIRAYTRGEESHLIAYMELYGDPAQPQVWQDLDEVLNRSYRHDSGVELQICSCGIDSGGHFTQEVYNFVRHRSPRCFALKGMSQPQKPIIGRPTLQDISYKGQTIKAGVQLWPIGTDTAKSTIYSRLRLTGQGPGVYHFFIGTPEQYFQELTAEKQITKFQKGFPKPEWIKLRSRNEALDCEVYAYAAALRAGLARIDWDRLHIPAPRPADPAPPSPAAPTPGRRPMAVAKSKWFQR